MKRQIPVLVASAVLLFIISSCNRKVHPAAGGSAAETPAAKRTTVKTAVPSVIVVNDSVAKKSVDGRYYYDLDGHRYWRNNKDGKYYLFNKSMYDNPDFKPPAKGKSR